jgi:hypothetical protein
MGGDIGRGSFEAGVGGETVVGGTDGAGLGVGGAAIGRVGSDKGIVGSFGNLLTGSGLGDGGNCRTGSGIS